MSTSKRKPTLEPVNEDTIQCMFYSLTIGSDKSMWKELCFQINDTIATMSKDYIWHRDEFQVYMPIVEFSNSDVPEHLCSNTCFGDNIEDEWFIVYIVLEISKKNQDLIIQIIDNDGDLLLIEAADYLPKWVNPENMENRVFIHKGHIYIIQPEMATLDTKLELKTSIEIISQSNNSTQASKEIEQAIIKRIGNYPEKLQTNIHRAVVKLPSNLAALLVLKPSLIAAIVNAYCNHDTIDAKCCKNINFSEYVRVEVKFTKYLYASLIHSKLINIIKHLTSDNDKERILGLKLMCGFHMITSNISSDMFSSKEYQRFVNSLKLNGYFKSNIEGSKEYKQLLENANEYFSIVECPISLRSHCILQMMESSSYKQIKESMKDKYVVEPSYTGDNEDWLNISPEQLNELLLVRYGKTTSLQNTDVISPQTVTKELSSFLKQTSDFEGIEPNYDIKSEENKNIEFDSDQFVSCMEKMLNILSRGGDLDNVSVSDNDDEMLDDSEDEECGKELKAKLQHNQSENFSNTETILTNIVKSMKEEKASTGPASNIFRTMGINKCELLDSDDDVD